MEAPAGVFAKNIAEHSSSAENRNELNANSKLTPATPDQTANAELEMTDIPERLRHPR